METQNKVHRGGNMKRAPEGFYTARQAMMCLGLPASTFHWYVSKGRIRRHIFPPRKEGVYLKDEIEKLANSEKITILLAEENEVPTTKARARIAQGFDALGIEHILRLKGWQTATPEQRLAWWKVNPVMDHVVEEEDKIQGYITAPRYIDSALEGIMSGEKRAWHMSSDDILPYTKGPNILYVGIAIIQDEAKPKSHIRKFFAAQLINEFTAFLETLASQDIYISQLHAISDQPDGQNLCDGLGFIRDTTRTGRYPRYILDIDTSPSRFAERYRKAAAEGKALREIMQNLENFTQRESLDVFPIFIEATTDMGKRILRAAGFSQEEGSKALFTWYKDKHKEAEES
jgi:hypothetical protein